MQRVRGDGGGGAALPGAQADDHHGAAHQVQVEAHRGQQRQTRRDNDADTEAHQPPQTEHQRQNVPQHQPYLMNKLVNTLSCFFYLSTLLGFLIYGSMAE